jgi:hypothetical protein
MTGDSMQTLDFLKAATSISAASPTASALFMHFASRQRNRKVEKVTYLVAVCGNRTTRKKVIFVLKQLQTSGFGRFIKGRNEYDSRFIWGQV